MSEPTTSALRYRELIEARRKAESTYKKISPSGMEWELRPIDVQSFIMAGKLPLTIAQKMVEAESAGQDLGEAFAELSVTEQFDAIAFLQFIVTQICVNPKIVKKAEAENEIDEILPEDFSFLVSEAMGGQKEADGLNTFRSDRGPNSLAGTNGKKFRAAPKRAGRN